MIRHKRGVAHKRDVDTPANRYPRGGGVVKNGNVRRAFAATRTKTPARRLLTPRRERKGGIVNPVPMLIILLVLCCIVVSLGMPIGTRPGESVFVAAEYVGNDFSSAPLVARYGAFAVGATISIVTLIVLIVIIIPTYQFLVSLGIIRGWYQQRTDDD